MMYRAKFSMASIARILKIPCSTTSTIIYKWLNTGVTVAERPGRSGTTKFSPRLLRNLKYMLVDNRRRTGQAFVFSDFSKRYGPFSKSTLKRWVKKLNFRRRPSRKRQVLKEAHRRKRRAWVRTRRHWNPAAWQKVIFSDECKIKIGYDKMVYVWKAAGEGSYRPDIYGDHDIKPKVELMIWGCITYNGVGTIQLIEGNVNSISYRETLIEYVWPVILKNFPHEDYLFQDDGASVHTAKIIKEYKSLNGMKTLPWPAKSPDLNIIENLWFILKHDIQKVVHEIKSVDQLKRAVLASWGRISQQYVRNLYDSIPRRLKRVQVLKGHLTKY